ncbi:MAG: hypothetical protein JKY99_03865 [Rhizobiales bacterium]|nr:hypothetical protein [Hyphomicrobiales bacterium]
MRKALAHYYLTSGADDPVRILIPKGGYKVEFFIDTERKSVPDSDNDSLEHLSSTSKPKINAIAVAVLPFSTRHESSEQIYFAEGLSDELTTGLARIKSLSLAPRSSTVQYREPIDLRKVGAELGVDYIIEGSMQQAGRRLRVTVQLIDTSTGEQMWAQTYNRTMDDIFTVHNELVSNMIMELRLRIYNAVRNSLEQQASTTPSAWELFMRSNWIPGAGINSLAREKKHMAIALHALEIDPQSGKAHSVMADKLSYLANVNPQSDTTEQSVKAAYHARRALEFDPVDADVLFNVSIHYWHAGRLRECLGATKRTLELEPNHLLAGFLIHVIPYTNAHAPQEIIDGIISYDAALAGDNLARWVTLTWASMLYLNNGKYDQAAEYGWRTHEIYKTPDTRNRLCAALVQIGETKSAVDIITDAVDDWPTLDMHHYANVVIPRRYGESALTDKLQKVYLELADAYQDSRVGSGKLTLIK